MVTSVLSLLATRRIDRRLTAVEQELVISRVVGVFSATGTSTSSWPMRVDTLKKSRLKRNGLEPKSAAPAFALPTVRGDRVIRTSDLAGKDTLFVFSDPDCVPCGALWPQLLEFAQAHPRIQIVIVARGEKERVTSKYGDAEGRVLVVTQTAWQVSRAYATFQLPSAYHINANGLIAAPLAVGVDAIMDLAASMASHELSSTRFAEKEVLC